METDLKRLRQYEITMKPSKGNPYKKVVNGYRVILPGFEEYGLFVHRSFLTSCDWRITEVSTGCRFPDNIAAQTREKTISNLYIYLKEIGKHKLDNHIKKALELLDADKNT